MLTQVDRDEYRKHYLTRFRNQSIGNRLPVDQTETKEYARLDRQIKNLEAELSDARQELYILNKAFDTVSREERVRKQKALVGIRDKNNALIEEVYERTQQAAYLTGCNNSWRHELPNAYARIRRWVVNGDFHRFIADEVKYHPLWVEYQLLSSAAVIVSHDKAKKFQDLHDRVWARRNELWKEWCDADQPIRIKENEDDS